MTELRALGGLRLRDSADGHKILSVLSRTKPPGLLVYLALSPPNLGHGRDKLLELLWPGSSTEKARNSLNQTLHILRSALGPGVIGTTEGGDLVLEAGALWCDVTAFEEAVVAGQAREALELYQGHLWDPSELTDCLAFQRWLDGERERLRRLALGAAVTLAQELERDGNFVDAAQWLRKARAWAPYEGAVMLSLLQLLHRAGERAAAVSEYDAYEKRLAADLEMTPSAKMSELIEEIRSTTAGPEASGPALVAPDVAELETPVPPMPEATPTGTARHTDPDASKPSPAIPASTGSDRFWRSLAVGAVAAAIATVVAFVSWPPATSPESSDLDPRLVLVRPFSNETGRPDLQRLGIMAADWISQGLAETGVVRVVHTVPIGANADIDQAIAPAPSGSIRQAGTTVPGAFYSMRDSVSFRAQVIESTSGEILASVGPVLASVQDPRIGVEELRQRTTGALASVVDPLLASWVTATRSPPSFEAYQLFAQGLDAFFRYPDLNAMRAARLVAANYFRRAVELDSTYALAQLWEVRARQWAGGRDPDGRDSALDDLTSRRDELTGWEQNLLDAELAFREGDQFGQYQALSRLVSMRPGSEWNFRLGQVAGNMGRFAEAAALIEGVTDQGFLAGTDGDWWILTQVRHFAGQYERELQDNRAFRRRYPNVPISLDIIPLAALGRVEEALELARSSFDFASLVSELFNHGHSDAAQSVIRNHLSKVDLTDPAPGMKRHHARVLSWTGRHVEAEELLRPHLEENPADWHGWAVLVAVLIARGDREEAVRVSNHVDELDARAPSVKATTQARILMHLGDRAGAVEQLGVNFNEHRKPLQQLIRLHRRWTVSESMADYPPFQQLVGWPPPAPN